MRMKPWCWMSGMRTMGNLWNKNPGGFSDKWTRRR